MKFLHIGFYFTGPAKAQELEPFFNRAAEWIRYAPNCWIVKTDQSAVWWAEQLKSQIGAQDGLIIFEINPRTKWGYAQKHVWDWFDKQTGTSA